MIKTTCRLCNSAHLSAVVEFPPLPLVDAYSREPNAEHLYPCGLRQCEECGHIQLSEVIPGELLFRSDYLFQTADYPWLVEHYRAYADSAFREFAPQFVLEIGSNDGTLAQMFQRKGCEVLGVDPSSVPSRVPVLREFFGTDTVKQIARKADIIIANHVFAHNDDLRGIVEAVQLALAKHGVFIFETNAGIDLLQHHLFDIVYHEHMDYHTVAPLVRFFRSCGLQLFRVEHNESKGGTLRGYVCHDGDRPIDNSVAVAELSEEIVAAQKPWEHFNERLEARRFAVHSQLVEHKAIGYGAAAGGIATMYHLGLQDKVIGLVDDSPRRHGMYAPACNLIVRDPNSLYNYDVHHGFTKIVVLSWRYAQQIQARHPQLEMIVP